MLTELLACLIFLVFIPSFFVSDEIMNGTQMAKEFGLSITLAIVSPIALILWTIYNWKDLSIGITKIDILVVLFAAYCGFLVWHHGYTDRIEVKFFMYGSAYILFRMFFSSFKKSKYNDYSTWKSPKVYFPVALSLILSAHCIIGLLQLYGVMNSYHSYFKVTGMFFNPAPYAGFLIALSPLCIATYMELKRGMGKREWGMGDKIAANLLLGSFLLTLLVLPVTQSRAAWVAFAGAMAFLVWRYYPVKEMWKKYFPKTWMKASAISLVAVLMISSAVGLYYYKKDSADGRILIWKISSQLVSIESMLFGSGIDSFSVEYMQEQEKYIKKEFGQLDYSPKQGYIIYPYNEILRLVIETGFLGILIIFILFLIYLVRCNLTTIASVFGIFLFSLFSYPLSVLFIVLVIIMYLTNNPNNLKILNFEPIAYPVLSFAYLIIISIMLKVNNVSYISYKEWFLANKLYNKGYYSKSFDLYSKSFESLNNNGDFLIAIAKLNNILNRYELSNDLLAYASSITHNSLLLNTIADNYYLLGKYDESIKYFERSSYTEPNKIYPQYRIANIYFELGKNSAGKELAKKIINYNIKINNSAVTEMKKNLLELSNTNKIINH